MDPLLSSRCDRLRSLSWVPEADGSLSGAWDMNEPLTIRMAKQARISRDSGESRWLHEREISEIHDCLSKDRLPLTWDPGSPTACTLATIGEGGHARPAD